MSGVVLDPKILRADVIASLEYWGHGFLEHEKNGFLRSRLKEESGSKGFYSSLLYIFYRMVHLYLMEDIPKGDWSYFTGCFRRQEEREKGGEGLWSQSVCSSLMRAQNRFFDSSVLCRYTREEWEESLSLIHETLLALAPTIDWHTSRLNLLDEKRSYRKKTGAYYTPPYVMNTVLDAFQTSFFEKCEKKDVSFRICDPACGAGNFLLASARYFAKRISERGGGRYRDCLSKLLREGIFGVDLNPITVEVCKILCWVELGEKALPLSFWDRNICSGNAILGSIGFDAQSQTEEKGGFCWQKRFPAVFPTGFDLVIGNPPWVSFSGRHAEECPQSEFDFYRRNYQSFSRWPTLHSIFVERALSLLKEGGSLGFVLPAQIADLDGYQALRSVIRGGGSPIEPLPYFGEDAFDGVVQPSLGLIVHKVRGRREGGGPFRLQLDTHVDLDVETLLARLDEYPNAPNGTFKDMGVHTGNCSKKIILNIAKEGSVPIYEGKDIAPFSLGAPRKWFFAHYEKLKGEYYRSSAMSRYQEVKILIRQTAARPIAAIHYPRHPFRNSILGCFGMDGVSDFVLLCWLNSTAVAWFHRYKTRESNQKVFPQIKISHLKRLPVPVWDASLVQRMIDLECHVGEEWAKEELDWMTSAQLGLSQTEHQLIVSDIS